MEAAHVTRQSADEVLSVGMAPIFNFHTATYMAALALLLWLNYRENADQSTCSGGQHVTSKKIAPLACITPPSQCSKLVHVTTRRRLGAAAMIYVLLFITRGSKAEMLNSATGGTSIWAHDHSLQDVPELCRKTLGFCKPAKIARPTADEAAILKDRAAQLQDLHNKAGSEQWPAYRNAQPLTLELACGLITTPVQHFNLTGVPVAISRALDAAQGTYPLKLKMIGESTTLGIIGHIARHTNRQSQASVIHDPSTVEVRHTCKDKDDSDDTTPGSYLSSLGVLPQQLAPVSCILCPALQATTLRF